ncbi:NAD-dependent DNA ligase LigA [Mycoplasma crocodyli]|uniref:DNA ligase n=1 Tax=Mycoplasma crocodyli (strain ATCC 51981 / MP145) TaxID=512564 RepID=D5E675_MYCCM|nr:NAD-dependent DNA ligase LigA [Mycoplasma crocodyli]ADE19918.1 DNA ligase (NAD(+)) [Mycoplasma crocodyli MP145]
MNQKVIDKYQELIAKIKQYNNEYYNLDQPSVSDAEYDALYKELLEIEKQNPKIINQDSPSQIIGGFASSKFSKYTHQKLMLSLDKATHFDEITKFYNDIFKVIKTDNKGFFLEPKVDGLSISLHYENGILQRAVTRGDGLVGEDVSENVLQIKEVKHKIAYKKPIEIRGEIYLSKENFNKLNKKIEDQGLKSFANPRNAASGTLRQLDKNIVRERNLGIVLYELVDPLVHKITSQDQSISFINQLGFPTQKNNKLLYELDDILNYIEEFGEIKNNLDYDCDGLVIKYNDIEQWKLLGFTSKFPKYAIAYKYQVEEAITRINKISISTGRTGKINYLAHVEPVELNQSIVSKATLHNYNYIEELNLNIGDDVVIIKAGEIIPKVRELKQKKSIGVFPKLINCLSCKSKLEYIDDNLEQYCLNKNCQEKIINSLIYFASKPCLDIKGMGDKVVKILYENGLVLEIKDFFELHNKRDKMLQLPSFKEKKVDNLINAIETIKKAQLHKVIIALGMKNIGTRSSKLISTKINKLSDLLTYNIDELENIDDIGPKSIASIKEFLSEDKNKELITFLDNYFIQVNDSSIGNKLVNLSFSITGTLLKPRDYFVDLIEKNGGQFHKLPTSKTNYLIVGENPGSAKINKAKILGTQVITIDEFEKMI